MRFPQEEAGGILVREEGARSSSPELLLFKISSSKVKRPVTLDKQTKVSREFVPRAGIGGSGSASAAPGAALLGKEPASGGTFMNKSLGRVGSEAWRCSASVPGSSVSPA